jgi:phosphatidylserine/phosphatidylglycerophosphate/cardiolipin synthase-like enzyme
MFTQAARRGVDVRLLVGGRRTDIPVTWWAGCARYERLLAAGVRIYGWQPSTLHAETFVVDGLWSSIGTMNFDNRSLALNDEVTLMVLDADVGVAWRRNSAMTCSGQRRSRRRASRNAPGGSGWARRWPSS